MDDVTATGLALSSGGYVGSSMRAACQLRLNARVASAVASSTVTPGFRRTITFIHPHWYREKYVFASSVPVLPAYVVIGMYTAGGFASFTPLNPSGATPMIRALVFPT
jgi:hypothetical protein